MSTFTLRVTSSATNPAGTAYGESPDLGAPSYWDVVITGSTDPALPNGVYDGYCLNPNAIIRTGTSYSGEERAGDALASYTSVGLSTLTTAQVSQINWVLAQNFTSDAKFAGQFNYGEVQSAIWKLLGFTDAQIADTDPRFLSDNLRNTISASDIDFLVHAAQTAVASGHGVVPTDAYFSTVIDPAGDAQPLIIQLQSAKLGNFVWEDTNKDGLQSTGELGIDNVVVELYDGTGHLIASTVTGDDFSTAAVEHGFYQFAGLKAGDYQVKFIAPAYTFTGQDAAGNTQDAIDSDADASGLSHVVSLAVGESNQTIDAGLVKAAPLPSSISGFVYEDTGNDGVKGAGEPGIPGVTVTLTGTDDLGNPVSVSTTTGADGSYKFDGLRPGTYTVTETQPAGYLDGKDTAGSTGGTVTDDKISTITLGAGVTSVNNNFGELSPSKISGFVYEDTGNDGVKGAGEPGIPGVTVTLTGTDDLGNPVSVSTTTGADGSYKFDGLRPGTYTVTETQPAGYLDGKDTAGSTGGTVTDDKISTITLGAGVTSVNNNFGELSPSKISGFVYEDTGNDGVKGAGEPGIPGVTVTLTGTDDLGNPVSVSTTTGADGSYKFDGLRPGTYTVTETQPAGYLDGKDTAGSTGGTVTDDKISTITLGAGVASVNNNFGELKAASLSGFVYEDTGNDGVKGAGEPGIPGVTVTLTGTDDLGNPVSVSTTTGADGSYKFDGLRPGTYTVTETQPAGYLDGKDTAGSTGGTVTDDKISTITLGAGVASVNNNFGELKAASLSGFVYEDAGNDGVKGAGEAGIAGVTVKLTGTDDLGNPVSLTTTTGADGSYSFATLRPGTYTVTETQPAGYLDGKDTAGSTGGTVTDDKISTITLGAGVASVNNNFGELKAASLSGFVYEDAGNDGVKGAGEAGIAGVTVKLTGTDDLGNPVSLTTTTGADGSYSFATLRPGTYTVTETQPAGYLDGKDTAGSTGGTVTDDKISTITLGAGVASVNNNFGELKAASLSGFVYEDAGNDGVKGAGEAGIAGVTVKLTGTDDLGNPVSLTTTTGADGSYSFATLRPGTYTVTETQPAGYLDGKDTAGSTGGTVTDDKISTITLGAGVASVNNNFGELKAASLSGFVYEDAGNDGVKGAGEAGIAGVTVKLTGTDDLGNPVSLTTTTGADGSYSFATLRPGTYTVTETQPAGYLDGKDTAGSTGGTVTDDKISTITLGAGVASVNNNFGELKAASLSGFVYEDAGNDGVKGAGEAGIAGVTVKLTGTDDLGNPVSLTTTTGADGSYSFATLRPGTYTVTETQPAGYLDGKDTAGSTGGTVTDDKISTITLGAGVASVNNNFGELKAASLSGFVYEDAGNDGVKGAGEAGIAGVTVKLTGTDDLGNPVSLTTTTGADGSYSFATLRPGTYTVTETQPAGYLDGKDTAGSTGGTVTDDKISTITLGAGVASVNNNFGELKAASLSGYVYHDANNDGSRSGEAGIAGATVTLTGTNDLGVAVTVTTTTDANGFYNFANLRPGTYSLTEGQPVGYLDGKDTIGTPGGASANDKFSAIVLAAGVNGTENNFGELKAASLGDKVFLDTNGNGQQDAGEAGVAGVTVNLLDSTNATIATQVTNGSGNYLFTGLNVGTYSVQFVGPAGYSFTTKDAAGVADSADSDADATTGKTGTYTLASGETNLTVDAGVVAKLGSLGDRVWYDCNANGVQDSGETGLAGVTVKLIKAGADGAFGTADDVVAATTTTNASGNYLFGSLAAGSYQVQFANPTGYALTKQDVGGNTATTDLVDSDANTTTGRSQVVNLAAGENNLSVDAGVYKVGVDIEKYVSGNVCTTTNNTGGEGANCGYWKSAYSWDWSSYAYVWSGTGCKTSDTFNSVFGVSCSGGTQSLYSILCGTSTATHDVFMRECVAAYLNACHGGVNYGYTKDQVCGQVKYAESCGDYSRTCDAFQTENNQGCSFSHSTKSTWSCVTDTALYDADAPPGLSLSVGSTAVFTYIVKNTGDTALKNVVVTDDRIATVTYVSGDTNNNGLLDTSETWTYKATEVVQSGTIKNTGTVTATDATGGVTGVTDKDDAYYTGVGKTPTNGSIGDRVWYDCNANGVQDSGEVGIAGIKVTLKAAGADGLFGTKDDTTSTTTTNSTGYYEFTNLAAGKYQVVVEDKAGNAFTKKDVATTTDAKDSDVDATGTTGVITLAAGEHNLTVDAGVYHVGIDVEKYVSGSKTTSSNNSGGEGANCGYWKTAYCWDSASSCYSWAGTGCKTSDTFNSVFGVSCSGGTQSLYTILCGTSTAAHDVFMRECVAAYLNACHGGVNYCYTKEEVCTQVKYAESCGSYTNTCDAFKTENNLGCTFSHSTKSTWSCVTDTALYDADCPPGLELTVGSTATFTYIVKNTGDTALKNVVLTDDRIATVTYVSGDTNNNGLLDTTETWTYKATEVVQAGTIKNTGTVTATDAVGGSEKVTDKDDAYYTGVGSTATKGSIGDRVWEDANYNGIQDAGEWGLGGVKVTLKGAGTDGVFGTKDDISSVTYTNGSGYYEFKDLLAGKYQVVFGDGSATGYAVTKQNVGANDAVDSDIDASGATGVITLAAGEHNLTVDAGVYRKACVGDKVFEDWNHNNVQDSGEGGIGGITVSLLSSTGSVLATTKTDGNGNYLFSNLDPGSYVLQFDKTNVSFSSSHWGGTYNMNDWKWAVKNAGTNDAIDSDVAGDAVSKTNVSRTDVFTLISGQSDMTRDAGITPIVIDLDGNGIHTVSRADATGSFDLLGTGTAIKSGWISSGDGFLAVDKNGNGQIDGISELFGGTAKGAGYAALAAYDSNGDGVVNSLDANFGDLRIWQDANGNHSTDAGELMTLAQAGIASLQVSYSTDQAHIDAQGNLHLEQSSATLASGDSVGMTDVYFNVSAEDAAAAGVQLPTMADLLGNDRSLDTVVGSATATAAVIDAGTCSVDASEALRKLAAATQQACQGSHAA